MRRRIEDLDSDAGVANMLDDFHEAYFHEGHREDEPEPSAKQYTTCWVQHNNPFTGILRLHN